MKKNTKIRESLYIKKDIPLFYCTPFENIQGMLNGVENVEKLYNSIKPCTCGGKPEGLQTECMGDFDFTIYCDNPECNREIYRSMYDFDVTLEQDEIALAIRDWNDGMMQEEIEEIKRKEKERITLTAEDLEWKDIYANNLKGNPIEGTYSIVNAKVDDSIKACKWSIVYQRAEKEPMLINSHAKTELYILFMERYFDLKEPLEYPEPSDKSFYDVNSYGDFVRAYKTLDEAKIGAAARCGWQGINRDTKI